MTVGRGMAGVRSIGASLLDQVLAETVDPAYQQLRSVPAAIGCDVALWRLRQDGGFRFDLDDLYALATPGTRMIVINTPARMPNSMAGNIGKPSWFAA